LLVSHCWLVHAKPENSVKRHSYHSLLLIARKNVKTRLAFKSASQKFGKGRPKNDPYSEDEKH
jgi:hypothetical protein